MGPVREEELPATVLSGRTQDHPGDDELQRGSEPISIEFLFCFALMPSDMWVCKRR